MKKILVTLMTLTVLLWAEDAAVSFEFVGAQKCKMCHKSAKKGDQFSQWEASVHATAFETLKSEQSAEIAKKMGLKTPAFEAPECLSCHTTGFGAGGYEVKDAKFWNPAAEDKDGAKAVKRMTALQNVGCESCHGAGDGYKAKKVMTALFVGETEAASVGLIRPDKGTCTGCHNEKSPTFDKEKGFIYEEMLKQVTHPYPAEIKAELKTK